MHTPLPTLAEMREALNAQGAVASLEHCSSEMRAAWVLRLLTKVRYASLSPKDKGVVMVPAG